LPVSPRQHLTDSEPQQLESQERARSDRLDRDIMLAETDVGSVTISPRSGSERAQMANESYLIEHGSGVSPSSLGASGTRGSAGQ